MAAACLASFAIFAGGLLALYGLDWYKNRKTLGFMTKLQYGVS